MERSDLLLQVDNYYQISLTHIDMDTGEFFFNLKKEEREFYQTLGQLSDKLK